MKSLKRKEEKKKTNKIQNRKGEVRDVEISGKKSWGRKGVNERLFR